MTVRVARGALSRMRRSPDFFVLQVREAPPDRAAEALTRAAADIAGLSGGEEFGGQRTPSFVSEVIPTPSGPIVQVDAEALPRRTVEMIPELVVQRLREQGVTEAVVDCPATGGPLDTLATWPQGAVLHLHPAPGRGAGRAAVPGAWLDEATGWLAGGPLAQELAADLGTFQVAIAPRDAPAVLAAAAHARADCLIVAGSPEEEVRGVHLHHRIEPALLLAGGGAKADLPAVVGALQQIARRLAPTLAYAFVSIEPTLSALRRGEPTRERGRDWAPGLVRKLADEVALDAFPWQVLSTGHLQRRDGAPPGTRPLEGGRVELAVGDVREWLPGSPTLQDAREAGRALLGNLLVTTAEATALARARRGR